MSQFDDTYKIASSDTPGALAEMVNAMCAEGWIPQGGIAVVADTLVRLDEPTMYGFYQAMVRAPRTVAGQ